MERIFLNSNVETLNEMTIELKELFNKRVPEVLRLEREWREKVAKKAASPTSGYDVCVEWNTRHAHVRVVDYCKEFVTEAVECYKKYYTIFSRLDKMTADKSENSCGITDLLDKGEIERWITFYVRDLNDQVRSNNSEAMNETLINQTINNIGHCVTDALNNRG